MLGISAGAMHLRAQQAVYAPSGLLPITFSYVRGQRRDRIPYVLPTPPMQRDESLSFRLVLLHALLALLSLYALSWVLQWGPVGRSPNTGFGPTNPRRAKESSQG